jgi:hypothetical protein
MKSFLFAIFKSSTVLVVLTSVSLILTGCGGPGGGQAKTEEEVRTGLSKSFGGASPEAKALADEAAAALKAQEDAKAFIQLNALAARQDLSREQRAAAAESMLTVNKRLSEAAARGDKDAAKLVEEYRAGK